MGCKECPLNHAVEVPYRGNEQADIIICAESPGAEEIRQGQPFVGMSGQLLMEQLALVGIDPESVFYTNSARCRIEKDSMSAREIKTILSCCRDRLEIALNTIKPKVIILCGAIALEQIMRLKGIKKARSKWFWSEEFKCQVMPTWHPAYILRNRTELENFRSDLQKVSRYKNDEWTFEDDRKFTYHEVETIIPLLNGGFMREDGSFFRAKGHRVIRVEPEKSNLPYVTAIDCETQGLNWWDPNSIIISYSVAASTVEGWTVYLHEEVPIEEADFTIKTPRGGTKKKPNIVEIGIKRVPGFNRKVEELRELCKRNDIKKYFANLKYEKHRFYNLGITEINNAPMDVMLASHALDSERFLNNTLSQLIDTFTNFSINFKDSLSEAEKSDMLGTIKIKRDIVNRYACSDAFSTLAVALQLRKELAKDEKTLNYYINFVHHTECDLLFDMERNGVLIDTKRLPVVKKKIKDVMADKIKEFKRICPKTVVEKHKDNFKLSRRIILTEALFDFVSTHPDGTEELHNYGYHIRPIEISSKSKLPKCDKDVMSRIIDSPRYNEKAKELVHIYREWSDHNTLLTRYVKNIEGCLTPSGRIHPSYSFKFTSSGRTGARSPSIQNFPKRGVGAEFIRSLIIAPKGKVLIAADQSMAELRFVAHVANERKMKEIFKAHGDIHLSTGREVAGLQDDEDFAKISKEKAKKIRQDSKAINFGFVYGMSAEGFRVYARSSYRLKITLGEAIKYREAYFNLYRDLEPWHNDCRREIVQNACIRSVFGRKRVLLNAKSRDTAIVASTVRIGTNAIIQCPSSDCTLMGGTNISKDPKVIRSECSINIFIHDALIFEVDEDKINKYAILIKKNMENIDTTPYNFLFSVPLVVDIEYGKNLYNIKEYKFN